MIYSDRFKMKWQDRHDPVWGDCELSDWDDRAPKRETTIPDDYFPWKTEFQLPTKDKENGQKS